MPTEIKMPQLGESVHEGTIGRWLKRPGDPVAKYEPLVEVITDKVNVEMPSPFGGVLREILVAEGATVVVGTPIAVVEEQARTSAPAGPATAPAAAPPAAMSSSPAAPGSTPDGGVRPADGIVDVDVAVVVRPREAHKAAWQAREGANISITAFVVRAATRALRAFPMVNAAFTLDGVLYKGAINFGVGVAIPDGLIVPVVKDADRKTVVELAKEIAALSARAREGKLTLEDVSGGTFTLTNAGVFGSIYSMPIINYPQAAILATDAIVRRPVVVGEGIAIREIMHLGLAFDHRVFDGAIAMQFLTHIKQQLEGFAPAGDTPAF